jgi:predicted MFS family arabinose efflux permease
MRGGAIPNFLWGTGMLALLAANAIWTKNHFQIYLNTFAVVVTFGFALALTLMNRAAIRKGPPRPEAKLEAAPSTSVAGMMLGVAIGAMLFGVVFGKFLVYLGGGLWLLAFGRLIIELRAQRRFVERLNVGRRQ